MCLNLHKEHTAKKIFDQITMYLIKFTYGSIVHIGYYICIKQCNIIFQK